MRLGLITLALLAAACSSSDPDRVITGTSTSLEAPSRSTPSPATSIEPISVAAPGVDREAETVTLLAHLNPSRSARLGPPGCHRAVVTVTREAPHQVAQAVAVGWPLATPCEFAWLDAVTDWPTVFDFRPEIVEVAAGNGDSAAFDLLHPSDALIAVGPAEVAAGFENAQDRSMEPAVRDATFEVLVGCVCPEIDATTVPELIEELRFINEPVISGNFDGEIVAVFDNRTGLPTHLWVTAVGESDLPGLYYAVDYDFVAIGIGE